MTRRQWLALAGSATAAGAKGRLAGLRIGVTDWNLKLAGRVEAVALARKLGFAGVEVSLGRKIEGNRLPLADVRVQDQYLAAAKEHGISIAGTCLDVLHINYLKNDKLGQKWIADGIPITRRLGARVMLLPFFGKGKFETRAEMDYVGDVLRELGPAAEQAGVTLGIEDTISAEDNARIMDRSRSKAVKTYYDIGNSTLAGFDPVQEIPWLGGSRICQFHLKDNPHYLGAGKIDMPGVVRVIAGLGDWEGYANLETESPSQDVEADMRRNLGYLLGLLQSAKAV